MVVGSDYEFQNYDTSHSSNDEYNRLPRSEILVEVVMQMMLRVRAPSYTRDDLGHTNKVHTSLPRVRILEM